MRCHASTLQQLHNRFVNVGIRFDIFKQGVVTVEGNSFNIHEFLSHVYCYAFQIFQIFHNDKRTKYFHNIPYMLTRLTLIFMQIAD